MTNDQDNKLLLELINIFKQESNKFELPKGITVDFLKSNRK